MIAKKTSALSKPILYDDAFITSVLPYGESDCIVRMLTRDFGRISAFFKAGFKRKSQNAPQAPSMAAVGFIGSSGKLFRLVSCDIIPNMHNTSSLKIFGYSVYIAEIVEKLLPEEDASEEVFAMVEEIFSQFFLGNASASLLRAFELKFLDYCGYLPEIPRDKDISITAFDPLACRFMSESSETTFAFSDDAIKLARAMLIAKIGHINYEGENELLMIGRIFQSRLKLMGLFPLKSVAFLKQLSPRG